MSGEELFAVATTHRSGPLLWVGQWFGRREYCFVFWEVYVILHKMFSVSVYRGRQPLVKLPKSKVSRSATYISQKTVVYLTLLNGLHRYVRLLSTPGTTQRKNVIETFIIQMVDSWNCHTIKKKKKFCRQI